MPFASPALGLRIARKLAGEDFLLGLDDNDTPEQARTAHALGVLMALRRFGLKNAAEELRLKIPTRTFHGLDAAHKPVGARTAKQAESPDAEPPEEAVEGTADEIAEMLTGLETPQGPGAQTIARDPLDRATTWGAPSNLAGGDTASRLGDMGQTTSFGGI